MSGRRSKNKGYKGEDELRKLYVAAGFDCARVPMSGAGSIKGDIWGIPGVFCEVKRVEKLNIWDALSKAEQQAKGTEMPTVHFRRNADAGKRVQWYVSLRLEDFQELLAAKRDLEAQEQAA